MVAAVTVGAAVVGGAISSQAAGSAADTQADAANNAAQAQAQSSRDANATQRYFYDTSRSDNMPFLQNGVAASNKLSSLLGISAPGSNTAGLRTQDEWTADNYRNGADQAATTSSLGNLSAADAYKDYASRYVPSAADAASADPSFGSLTKQFSAADLAADPVYNSGLQFGLDEGVKGINRTAAANGGLDSGATLKALTQFGNDYGSTKANDSYNRYMNTQTQTYNKYAGVAGAGQQASSTIGSAGSNAASGISSSDLSSGNAIASGYIGAGNATAAGQIGSANALSSGLTGGINSYNQQNLLSKLLSGNSSGYSTGGLGSSSSSGGTYFGI